MRGAGGNPFRNAESVGMRPVTMRSAETAGFIAVFGFLSSVGRSVPLRFRQIDCYYRNHYFFQMLERILLKRKIKTLCTEVSDAVFLVSRR